MDTSKLKKYIKRMLEPQFIRFLFTAALNTAVGWCIFATLRYLFGLINGIDALFWANFFGTIISVLFNFRTYGALVFRNKDFRLIFRFVLVYSVTFFCNYFLIRLFKDRWDINNYVAAAIVAVPIGFLNYFLNKFFTYVKERKVWHYIFLASLLLVEVIIFILLKVYQG
ncbi:MAG: GtrA family protein [Bacteroidales bacterium]|nr:GtrA family protein [Bacteroidales bacterium]